MTSNEKSIATLVHLSALSQYFIPFGNYIFPILLWSSKKEDSDYINQNGKSVLNFQLSLLLYSLVLVLIAVPIFIHQVFKNFDFNGRTNYDFNFHHFDFHHLENGQISGMVTIAIVAALVFFFMKIMEFFLIIYAAVKTSNGENYKYPLSIPFFK